MPILHAHIKIFFCKFPYLTATGYRHIAQKNHVHSGKYTCFMDYFHRISHIAKARVTLKNGEICTIAYIEMKKWDSIYTQINRLLPASLSTTTVLKVCWGYWTFTIIVTCRTRAYTFAQEAKASMVRHEIPRRLAWRAVFDAARDGSCSGGQAAFGLSISRIARRRNKPKLASTNTSNPTMS